MVPIRFSEEEVARLKASAEAGGRSVSAEVRHRLFQPGVTIAEARAVPEEILPRVSMAEALVEAAQAAEPIKKIAAEYAEEEGLSQRKPVPDGLSNSKRVEWLRKNQ